MDSEIYKDEVNDVLYRIQRGLAGYVSYLAACEMNVAFSEYVLYEPMLRILTARGFSVQSEVECPGYARNGRGDAKRLDFVACGHGNKFGIEVKWVRNKRVKLNLDIDKLEKYREANPGALGFICLFGKKSSLSNIAIPNVLTEQGKVYTLSLVEQDMAVRFIVCCSLVKNSR